MIDNLTDENFLIYAIKAYNRPNCVLNEFEEDMKRVKYIKRLIRKYRTNGELKERLILNHIIVLYNVLGAEATIRILFFKIEPEYYDVLKTFLLFLNLMPNTVHNINGQDIISSNIAVDMNIAKLLRNL